MVRTGLYSLTTSLLLAVLLSVAALGQGTTTKIRSATALPATCTTGSATAAEDTIFVNGSQWFCTATNTWSQQLVKLTKTSTITANANSTVAQNLQSVALPAGYLNNANNMVRVEGSGVLTTQTSQTPTFKIVLNLCTVSSCGSGTVLALCTTTSAALTAAQSNLGWHEFCNVGTVTTGATGTVIGQGQMRVQLTANTASPTLYMQNNNAASAAIDLTGSLFFVWQVTFSTNTTTANSANQRVAMVY